MNCVFNNKFKKWVPVSVDSGSRCVNINELLFQNNNQKPSYSNSPKPSYSVNIIPQNECFFASIGH